MRTEELDLVADLPLFAELAEPYRRQLLSAALVQRVPTGVTLFEQGDPADFLYVLLDGAVELRADDADGHEAVVEVVQPVDNFILAAVVTDAPLLMTARTLSRSHLLLLPADKLRADLYHQPALALTLLAALAGHYRGLVRQIKALKLRTSAERIGCYLLSLARDQGAGSGTIELPYSKRALAERMGMTPENLSRAFATLRERGVRMNRSRVVIDDIDKLESFCRVDALIDGVERNLRVPGQTAANSNRPDTEVRDEEP